MNAARFPRVVLVLLDYEFSEQFVAATMETARAADQCRLLNL
jgi:hypothetical protein